MRWVSFYMSEKQTNRSFHRISPSALTCCNLHTNLPWVSQITVILWDHLRPRQAPLQRILHVARVQVQVAQDTNGVTGILGSKRHLPLSRYRAKLNNLYQSISNIISYYIYYQISVPIVYQWPSLENMFPIFRQTYFTICQGSSSRNSNRGISELSLISARSASVISPHFLMESDGRSTWVNLCQLNVMYTETWLKLLDFQLSWFFSGAGMGPLKNIQNSSNAMFEHVWTCLNHLVLEQCALLDLETLRTAAYEHAPQSKPAICCLCHACLCVHITAAGGQKSQEG